MTRLREATVMHRKVPVVCRLVIGVLGLGVRPALADGPSAARAARLTFSEGVVHVDRPSSGSGPAQLNMPLFEGQTVVTGSDGQAEVEFEDGSLARLTPNSSLTLAHLVSDGGRFDSQVTLGNGLAYFELRAATQFAYTIAAGVDRIHPVENTTFRVNLDEAPAAVAVLDGTAHVERAGSYGMDLHAGETFRSDLNEPGRYFLTQEIAPDTWDQWNEARDQMAADAASQNTAVRDGYAGTQGYGWSDLDANGRWYEVPGQGQVWQPAGGDAEDFDPYGNGSWVWYPSAGYVWASAYSWGWTPFRCGGWSYWDGFGWGWTPNGGCGGFGYAGFGYGYYGGYGGRLNIVRPPRHYGGPRFPPPGPGGAHPIVPVHGGPPRSHPVPMPPKDRMIAGVVARPLLPVGASYTARGGSAVGSSLRRDFPVDRATRMPVLGVQPGQGVARQGFVSGAQVYRGPVQGVQRPLQPNGSQGMRPQGNSIPGTYVTPNAQPAVPRPMPYAVPRQSAPRPQPYSAPRMAAPPAAVPRAPIAAPAPAPRAAAPAGGGPKR